MKYLHFEKKLNVLLGRLCLKINTNKRQQLSAADLRKLLNSVKSSKTAHAFPLFFIQKNILFKSLFQHVQINRNLFSTAVEVLFLLQGLQIHGRSEHFLTDEVKFVCKTKCQNMTNEMVARIITPIWYLP